MWLIKRLSDGAVFVLQSLYQNEDEAGAIGRDGKGDSILLPDGTYAITPPPSRPRV